MWDIWAIWIDYHPNVSNINCEIYVWKIVCNIKNRSSSLKEDSAQILVCTSFKYYSSAGDHE